MQNFPLVSVICLAYNHEAYVEEALESVLNQNYPNIELLIADDNSQDRTVFVIEKWLHKHPEIPFFRNTENLGNTRTFNAVAKHAKGEFIIDLAADDVLFSDCVSRQINTFQNTTYTNLGVVYGNLIQMDENGTYLNDYYTEKDNPESGNIYKMVIGRTTKICSVSSMVKKSVFDTVGYYDEDLAYEDLDFWIRASRIFDFEYIPEILVKKRELTSSLSAHFTRKNNQKSRHLNESSYLILKKAVQFNKNKEEHKLLLNRIRFELYKSIATRNFALAAKLVLLHLKVRLKSL
ncbi:glycosyltransferase family 2 protein [Flavobacterium suncheonense]|uniref:Beta-lactamase regulatory protein n=1 Tax=Flavobacterium suncheonense GH29-5 = DSM 17707 TaxID=1121899 RepID=A0A0A2MF74_9FLAO|nr:glycosyltransferase [Flavobacterium suncheonense]KGO90083.1 beta-lactamase regulatory protein [Flavobacterium suncheonense GH29-5 = DSM 17707]